MIEIECKTQQELESCCKGGNMAVVRSGAFTAYGSSQVRACDSSQVMACGSSQVRACGSSQVMAYDSSQVMAYDSSQVTAYDSSQVMAYGSSQVTAYGSSQVTACGSSQVMAYDSSQVRAYDSSQVMACDSSQVMACGSSQVRACGSSQVTASKQVAVSIHGTNPNITGGIKIKIKQPATLKEWFFEYGLQPKRGVVVLFKAVNQHFFSTYKCCYAPGTKPSAADWDGGVAECGGGLHFVPIPFLGLRYMPEATRFVACPVKVSEIAFHKNATHPDKVKAKRVCAPIWEVNIDGAKI